LNALWFDIVVMLAFGLLGWKMEQAKLPLAAFVIGFVLAPVAEENLCAGLMASGGSYAPLLTRPISLCLLLVVAVLLLRKKKVTQKAD
jgi:putative tricarboxylic transport membrane protein